MLSAAAVAFLLWLLYVHRPPSELAQEWNFLPLLNALLNGLSATALCGGMYFIKHRNVPAHRASMLAAFGFSFLFLVSYIVNHAIHGDTHFPGNGTARTVYLSILSSHIVLSVVALPLVLTTLFFALSHRFAIHRRVARVTFPIWLYVSVTGVVVFAVLKTYVY
jgi:putative membrane protein